jgi:hypothetical protein
MIDPPGGKIGWPHFEQISGREGSHFGRPWGFRRQLWSAMPRRSAPAGTQRRGCGGPRGIGCCVNPILAAKRVQ